MSIFIFTEIMFFVGLISAYLVVRSGNQGVWLPPGDIRLPIAATGFNTALLLISGVALFLSGRAFRQREFVRSRSLMGWSFLLGLAFVVFQGYEWVQLIDYGMSLHTGLFSACFFVIIGAHGLHALGASLFIGRCYWFLRQGTLDGDRFIAVQLFWFFVVLIWPILYWLVYF